MWLYSYTFIQCVFLIDYDLIGFFFSHQRDFPSKKSLSHLVSVYTIFCYCQNIFFHRFTYTKSGEHNRCTFVAPCLFLPNTLLLLESHQLVETRLYILQSLQSLEPQLRLIRETKKTRKEIENDLLRFKIGILSQAVILVCHIIKPTMVYFGLKGQTS